MDKGIYFYYVHFLLIIKEHLIISYFFSSVLFFFFDPFSSLTIWCLEIFLVLHWQLIGVEDSHSNIFYRVWIDLQKYCFSHFFCLGRIIIHRNKWCDRDPINFFFKYIYRCISSYRSYSFFKLYFFFSKNRAPIYIFWFASCLKTSYSNYYLPF